MAIRDLRSYHGRMTFHGSAGLLLGARDYTHTGWRSQLYPADLPREWRFIFYSHRYPAILMPMRAWAFDAERLSLWQEEAPPTFRMILEVPAESLGRFVAAGPWPQPLIAGCVVRMSRLTKAHIAPLQVLAHQLPVAVDFRVYTPQYTRDLSAIGVGVCGRPAFGLPPTGPFAVSLMGKGDRPLLGQALRELMSVSAPRGSALFFYKPQTAIQWTEEAQLLVSMAGGKF
ncbi:MAG: DUF72 domain-containing protein [Acidiferrobacter sp.]